MPLSAPVAFPLFTIKEFASEEAPGGVCACGAAGCTRVGKHPMVAWGELSYGDRVPLPAPGAGYGLKTGAGPKGSGVFVVDLDGPDAIDAFASLGPCPETYTVETPRGVHLYFDHPGFRTGNSAGSLAKGVDIRGDGGFVVGPGSPHRSGGTYSVALDVPPAPAPSWLLDWLRARPVSAPVQSYDGDVTDPAERAHRRDLYTAFLKTTAPCVEKDGGDGRLFEVVQHGAYDLSLPVEDVLALVAEHYDPRCDPPWGDELPERVAHKARDAKTKSTRPRAEPAPAGFFLEMPPLPVIEPRKRGREEIFWDAWDEPIDPPTWLVEGLIPVSTVGGFVAHGSSLKTWTMLSVGAAVAQGTAWLGQYATRKGRVLVLDYESGLYELRRRVRLLNGGRVDGLGAWAYPPRIDDPELWKRMVDLDVALVCVDSLAAGTPGVDENDKAAAYPLDLAGRFAEATGASVVFVHHSKKDDQGDARKAVRGSTAIFAAMDWCYGFDQNDETSETKRMYLKCIKPCMGSKPNPIGIELTNAGLAMFDTKEDDEPEDSMSKRIIERLRRGPVTNKDEVGGNREKRKATLEALIKAGTVKHLRDGAYVLDTRVAQFERVKEEIGRVDRWKTPAKLAAAAEVDVLIVDELVATGEICQSAEGRWVVVSVENPVWK